VGEFLLLKQDRHRPRCSLHLCFDEMRYERTWMIVAHYLTLSTLCTLDNADPRLVLPGSGGSHPCFRTLRGLMSVHTRSMWPSHASRAPFLPPSLQHRGFARSAGQIEYCPSWLTTTLNCSAHCDCSGLTQPPRPLLSKAPVAIPAPTASSVSASHAH